jgi:benzoate membrane transport protein
VPSNIPAVIFMRGQGFEPPERVVNVISGVGTIAGSFFGPVAVSLALPPVLLTAGPGAGERSIRYRSVFLPIAAGLGIALFASTAADLAVLVPSVLLLSMAGLALIGALIAALKEIAAGPLTLGPVVAFAIALSDMTVLGLSPFFWSLVLGVAVSALVERDGWAALRRQAIPSEDR